MVRDERSMVSDASHGDLDAVEELLARHLPGLEGFVRKRGGGAPLVKESATDLVQSVCREVLESMRDERFEYRGEAEFRSWLYEAALLKIKGRRRYWAADRRDPGLERAVPEEILPRDSATPSSDAVRAEEVEGTWRLLAELPERYRTVIELAHVQGLAHREIAERLGMTEGASRMLLSRALARLATLAREKD